MRERMRQLAPVHGQLHLAPMGSDEHLPPMEWLQHLHVAGQWERLEKFAAETLEADAEDIEAHFHRAWALLKLERGKEAGPHVEYLLRTNAEDVSFLKLAAFWHMHGHKRHTQARGCLETALKIDPEDAMLWYLAAIVETQLLQFEIARQFIARARQLDPDDADIAFLHISLVSMEQTGAKAAWQTVREHEKALALEPDNDSLIASMGDVYLDELEMPERAEELYRQALAIDPSDRHHQQRLWKAMQKRNFLFRTLRLPFSGMTLGVNLLRAILIKPWLILCYLLGFKLIIAYFVWLLAATIVFAPPALIAGWLVMSDLQRASRAADKVGRWWLDFHMMPMAVRLLCCLLLMAAFWWGLFALLGVPASSGFIGIGLFFGVHLAVMALRVAMRKSDSHTAAAALKKPPPLPSAGQRPRSVPPPLPSTW